MAVSPVLTESQGWIMVRAMCFKGCVQVRSLAAEYQSFWTHSEPEFPSSDPGWGESTQTCKMANGDNGGKNQ